MEANPVATAADRLARLKAQVEEGTKAMGESREELMRLFMAAEQQKPALQSSVYTWLYMYVYLSIYLSIYLYIYLSIYVYI